MGGPGAPGADETGDFSDGEDDVAANTAAQAAARAAFAEDKVADTFYSSDEEESEDRSSVTGSFVSGSGPSLTEPAKKFRVVIKVRVVCAQGLCLKQGCHAHTPCGDSTTAEPVSSRTTSSQPPTHSWVITCN